MTFRSTAAVAALSLLAAPLLGAGTLPGIRSSGTIVVQADVQGMPLNIGGNVALYHRGVLYRLDVLSLGFPGANATTNALASSLVAPGGVSFVYDAATGALTAWSSASHQWYPVATAHARSANGPAMPAAASDPLAALASVAAALQNVQSANIELTGHKVIDGHPTTDVDVALKRHLPGKPAEDYRAQVALADDLDGFPIQVALASTPTSSGGVGGKLRLDLTTVERATPDDAVFSVPAGYARASSLGAILGGGTLGALPRR